MVGIYKITNLINNKIYIGQSTDIKSRWIAEKTKAFNDNSNIYDTVLSRAFRKYGLNNFKFEILEECKVEELDEKEKYYIYYYNSLVPFGYNVAQGGKNNSSHPVKLTYDIVLNIVKDLQESSLTQLEIGKKYSISKDSVTDINLGHTWHNPLISYPIRKKEKNYCKKCGKEIGMNAIYCHLCSHSFQRKVERPSKEQLLEEIAKSSFVAVGKKYGVTANAIKKWCKVYNLPIYKKDIVKLYNTFLSSNK